MLSSRFLIIGCGNELRGDGAVGSLVAMTVNSWQLESADAIVAAQLSPALVLQLPRADYAIFVEPCGEGNCARTVQIQPVEANRLTAKTTCANFEPCNPHQSLINLTHQIYGSYPQAWIFKIPTEDFRFGQELSSTAKAGVSQAVKTIAQFLQTYQ